MSEAKQTADSERQTASKRRRVRVVNPASSFHGWQGSINSMPGMMTPEDNLPVKFATLDGPVYFRKHELKEEDE